MRRRYLKRAKAHFDQPAGCVLLGHKLLARRWRWDPTKVRRFIKWLVEDGALEDLGPIPNVPIARSPGTLYRIVRYADYAQNLHAEEDELRHPGDTLTPTPSADTQKVQRFGQVSVARDTQGSHPGNTQAVTPEQEVLPPPSTSEVGVENYRDRLRDWVGEAVDRFEMIPGHPKLWAMSIWGIHGPDGSAEFIYRTIPRDEWADVLRQTMDEYLSKDQPYDPKFFRSCVANVVAGRMRPVNPGGLTVTQERQREESKQAEADAYRRSRPKPRPQRHTDSLKGWQPNELQRWYDDEATPKEKIDIDKHAKTQLGFMVKGAGIPATELMIESARHVAIASYRGKKRHGGPQRVGEVIQDGAA